MADSNRYSELASRVVELMGGKENITFFTHCVTRLRFNVRDKALVRDSEILNIKGVLGCQWAGEQYQIIIGQSVGDAYDLIAKETGLSRQEAVEEDLGDSGAKFSIAAVFDAIAGCVSPCIPVLIGGGMIKVLLLILVQLGVLTAESGTYVTFNFVSDAPFYFLPVMIGNSAAKKFGANPAIGMTLGAVLLHPTFVAMVGEGTGGTVFGLPIAATSYSSNVFAMILTMWVGAYVERFFAKRSPEVLRSVIEPLATIVIMTPLMLCLLAPAGALIGEVLTSGLVWLYDTLGFVGLGILTAVVPLFVMTGMHMAFPAVATSNFATLGYDPLICVASIISNFSQGAACLAVALKNRDEDTRATSLSAAVGAIVAGVSEPALFGVTLKFRTPLYGVMIGNFVGAAVAGIFQCVCYAFPGSFALFGLFTFLGERGIQNVIYMVIACIVGMIAAFVATLVLYKPQANE